MKIKKIVWKKLEGTHIGTVAEWECFNICMVKMSGKDSVLLISSLGKTNYVQCINIEHAKAIAQQCLEETVKLLIVKK